MKCNLQVTWWSWPRGAIKDKRAGFSIVVVIVVVVVETGYVVGYKTTNGSRILNLQKKRKRFEFAAPVVPLVEYL